MQDLHLYRVPGHHVLLNNLCLSHLRFLLKSLSPPKNNIKKMNNPWSSRWELNLKSQGVWPDNLLFQEGLVRDHPLNNFRKITEKKKLVIKKRNKRVDEMNQKKKHKINLSKYVHVQGTVFLFRANVLGDC